MLLDQLEHQAPEHASRQISRLTMSGDKAGASAWADVMVAMAVLRMEDKREWDDWSY